MYCKNKRQTGSYNENLASEYLQKRGYSILERNFHCRFAEIDIIAQDGKYLCFIEVKYRLNQKYGAPEGIINLKKRKNISKGALFYMNKNKIQTDRPIRFDVIFIYGDNEKEINHIINAFDYIGPSVI